LTCIAQLPVEGQAATCGSIANWTNKTPFPLPYRTSFEAAQVRFADFAEYFADMQGIFRVEPNPYNDAESSVAAGGVLSQKVFALAHATTWGDPFGDPPTTLLGESSFSCKPVIGLLFASLSKAHSLDRQYS
jgi:hypothetical protein